MGGAGTAPPAGQLQTVLPPGGHSQGKDKTAWRGEGGLIHIQPHIGFIKPVAVK